MDVGNRATMRIEQSAEARALRHVPLFLMPPNTWWRWSAPRWCRCRSRPARRSAGRAEVGDRFFLIQSGSLAVTTTIAGVSHELTRMFAGEFLGEIALLGATQRTATVRSTGAVAAPDPRLRPLPPAPRRGPGPRCRRRRGRPPAAVADAADRFRGRAPQPGRPPRAPGRHQHRPGRGQRPRLRLAPRRRPPRPHPQDLRVRQHGPQPLRLRGAGRSRLGRWDLPRRPPAPGRRQVPARRRRRRHRRPAVPVRPQQAGRRRRTARHPHRPRRRQQDDPGEQELPGGKTLLHDVSLSILPGEFVAIVGGSGAGKTTLLDAMAGLRPATSGTVYYNGRDYYRDIEEYRHLLGYVPQDDILHRDMTVGATLGVLRPPPAPPGHVQGVHRSGRRRSPAGARPRRAGRGRGRPAQRRAAQAGQHRHGAARPSPGLLPRRADVGPRRRHRPLDDAAAPQLGRRWPHQSCSPPARPRTSACATRS